MNKMFAEAFLVSNVLVKDKRIQILNTNLMKIMFLRSMLSIKTLSSSIK